MLVLYFYKTEFHLKQKEMGHRDIKLGKYSSMRIFLSSMVIPIKVLEIDDVTKQLRMLSD